MSLDILNEIAATLGFCLNTMPGKTECVVSLSLSERAALKLGSSLDRPEDHAVKACGHTGIP